MNLSSLPDDQARVGYAWEPPKIGERALAEHMFYLNHEPTKILDNLDQSGITDVCDELALMVGNSHAEMILPWLDTQASLKSDIAFVKELYHGVYGEGGQSVIKAVIEIMSRRHAEKIVRGYFPNWRAK